MKKEVLKVILVAVVAWLGYVVMDHCNTTATKLEQNQKKLKDCMDMTARHERNMQIVCGAGTQEAYPFYIDCGEFHVPRWATCVCTTMCLQDYTLTYTNSERCKNWDAAYIKTTPEDEE